VVSQGRAGLEEALIRPPECGVIFWLRPAGCRVRLARRASRVPLAEQRPSGFSRSSLECRRSRAWPRSMYVYVRSIRSILTDGYISGVVRRPCSASASLPASAALVLLPPSPPPPNNHNTTASCRHAKSSTKGAIGPCWSRLLHAHCCVLPLVHQRGQVTCSSQYWFNMAIVTLSWISPHQHGTLDPSP